MTQEEEENKLFEKVVNLKHGYDKLYVIYEELRDLIKSGYDGPFMGEDIRGLFSSYLEFERWQDEQRRKEKNNP